MKQFRFLLIAFAAMASLSIQSCDTSDDGYISRIYPNALVTIKPVDANSFYMQLDEQTTLRPVNLKGSPYGDKEVRALVSLEEVNEDPAPYDKAVRITMMDSIRTKPAVWASLIPEENYGNDPVEILNSWTTIVEDGYFTISFQTLSHHLGTIHEVNLVAGLYDDPYTLEFRHNANGDLMGTTMNGIVAFKLSDVLPPTNGEKKKLTLVWNSYSGRKQAEFWYDSTPSTL